MSSVIQGSSNGDLQLIAGLGRSIVFTKDGVSTDLSVLATQGYVTSQISNLIDNAPGALDTLNELAIALGNDANFSTTITNILSDKANSADVYTSTEVDTLLSDKANSADVYTSTEVDTLLSDKANSADVYTSTEVDTLLSDKANSADVYTQTEIDLALQSKQTAFVTAPTSSIGAEGDIAGQIAFSSSHIYYCTADFTDGLTDIWARTPLTLESW